MKLKYYLRGLGIGILVTAMILGLVTKEKGNMTDEEIKARARELGMVEQRTLADVGSISAQDTVLESEKGEEEKNTFPTATPQETVSNEDSDEKKEEIPVATEVPQLSPEPQVTPVPTEEPSVSPEVTEAPKDKEEKDSDEAETPLETEPTVQEMQVIELAIVRGDSSYSVSKRLVELGLIADAKEYDTYLCKNGYDKKLNIGTYKLHKEMTEEEIAKIITKTR